MKLHLSTGLRAALLAAVCACLSAPTQAVAESVPAVNDYGDIWLLPAGTNNTTYDITTEDEGKTLLLADQNQQQGNQKLSVAENVSVSVKLGEWHDSNTNATYEKHGKGTLTITGIGQVISNFTDGPKDAGRPEHAIVSEGTLKLTYGSGNGFVQGTVTVKNGATLQLAATDALGYTGGSGGGNATDTLTLEEGSTLQLDERQTLSTNINMNNAAITKGENTSGQLEFFGGTLTATGDSNTMSANMKANANHNVKIAVTNATDKLTFTGSILNNGSNIVEKSGDGTLVFGSGSSMGNNVTLKVNDGTVDIARGGGSAFTQGKIEVNGGANLLLSAHDALGYNSGGAINTITLDGDANNVASMTVNAQQTMKTNLVLNGDTHVTGTDEIRTFGGTITATGTNNIIDAQLSTQQNAELNVVNSGDELTVTKLVKFWNADNMTLTKTGEGTLILNDPEKTATALNLGTLSITLSEGILDLSHVEVLTVQNFSIADGTTVILGENTHINLTGSLTVGEGVSFDVSDWCAYDEFIPYELFTYTGTGTLSATLPENVTIVTSTKDNPKGWLAVEGNGVMLIPEPTTATLSLLALAGLAARRRRK